MGIASSKVSDARDVRFNVPAHYSDFTFRPPTREHVKDPASIPMPSEKQDTYEAVIASLQRDLHATHERAEVALNNLSVLEAEVERLRHGKDDTERTINMATKAAKLSREKSSELEAEVEKLRAEKVNNTQQMYQAHKAPETGPKAETGLKAETASDNARRAVVAPIAKHENMPKVRTRKMEELKRLCNDLRKAAPNAEQVASQDVTGHIAEVQTIQATKYIQAVEITDKIMNGDKEGCDECLEVLELYLKLLVENKSILKDYKNLHQTATRGSDLNGKATDLINQQAETIRKLEQLPKPYWV